MSAPGNDRQGTIARLNGSFESFTAVCIDFRWLVIAASLAIFGGSIHIALDVEGEAGMSAFFYDGDPAYQAYESYREEFGSDEVAYIGYEVPGLEYGPWNVQAMEALISLTEALEDEVPFIYDVASIANTEFTVGTDEGLEISKIIDDWPLTQQELLERRDAYLKKPIIVGSVIDDDADFGALLLDMDRSTTDPIEEILAPPEARPRPDDPAHLENSYPVVSDVKIREILERPDYEAYDFYLSGDVSMLSYLIRAMFSQPISLLLITIAIVSLILLFAFRSMVGVTGPIMVLSSAVAMSVALMVVLGYKIGVEFSSTPTLLTAIGVAHSVHVLSEFLTRLRGGEPRREALIRTMSLVGPPCLLTSVTTAIGFASMSFIPIETLAQGALIKGLGVFFAFFFTATFLVALLSVDWTWFWHRQSRKSDLAAADPELGLQGTAGLHSAAKGGSRIRALLARFADFNIEHRSGLLGAFIAFIVVCAIGVTRVDVDTHFLIDYWPSSWIYQDTKKIDAEMGGTSSIVYLVDSGEDDAIKNPEVMREIERLQELTAEAALVSKSYSIADIVKDLNQSFHGDDPEYHVIPDSRQAIAQYLLLYESSGGEDAGEFVSSDYRRASLEVRLLSDRASMTKSLVEDLNIKLDEDPLEHSSLTITGLGALNIVILDYIVSSQLQGFSIAFLAITFVMVAIFKSVKIGLISMVPNLAPVFLALGAMGWLDIPLDYNKVMIAGIALGISVDDTIHLMTRFHHEFGIHRNYAKALKLAMGDVGRALIITSVALVLGFSALLFSELRSQAFYGILLSGALIAALVADFFFMPPLVLKFKPFGPEREEGSNSSDR